MTDTNDNTAPNEEDLRNQLRSALRNLSRREPLEPTYKRLLMQNGRLAAPPILPKDKTYRRVGADLRARVEAFVAQTAGKDPMDRLSQRQPLEEAAMRAALTLREGKEHEQQALLEATLASFPRRQGMDPQQRKRYLESIALGLQSRSKIPRTTTPLPPTMSHAEQTQQARRQAELDRQKAQARAREEARQKREEEERLQREQAQRRQQQHVVETPQQALHKLYQPIFKVLWNMEFAHLGGTNPFRMVIDRENCASVGAPDYFSVISEPMNLTYIQRKVDEMKYESLSAFFVDVELMLKNAILYNSDQANPYRIAAEEMKKKYIKLAKKVVAHVKKK